jgi:hypothetical protein
MDKPMVRFATVAAVISVVTLGPLPRAGPYQSGVVQAQEKKAKEKKAEDKKKEPSRGFTARQRQTQNHPVPGSSRQLEMVMTALIRECPQHGVREDSYVGGALTSSRYVNYADHTAISLLYGMKMCMRRDLPKDFSPAQYSEDPRPKLKRALAGEHKRLGRRTIDGIEAEGVEIRGTTGVKASFKIDSVVTQFWSSVATGYPVLVAQTVVGNNGAIRMTQTTDRFHWDVPLDPNDFKAKIPPDYQLVDQPQPGQGQGSGGFGRGAGRGSPAPPTSGQKTRR